MSTPPGGGPHDEGGQDGWDSPPPPPGPGQPGGQSWDQPAQQWDQPGQQPGWGEQQWGTPQAGYGGAPQTSGLAIGALVASILGFFCGVGFIVGLILGYSARNQIRSSGGQQTGEGIATAAIVIGWIGVALMVVGFIIFFAVLGATMPAEF